MLIRHMQPYDGKEESDLCYTQGILQAQSQGGTWATKACSM